MTMTTIPGPVLAFTSHHAVVSAAMFLLLSYLLSVLVGSIYNAFFGPLSKFPGPWSRTLSVWPLFVTNWKGTDNIDMPALHRKYGDAVRIGPNQISFIGDANVWKDVHGFRKHDQLEVVKDPEFYLQNVNNTPGLILSDAATHSRQRKIVAHAFSDRALKEQSPMLMQWARLLRTKLYEQVQRGETTNLLLMFNCTTFDIMGDLTFAEPLHMLQNSAYIPWVSTIFAGVKTGARIRAIKSLGDFSRWVIEGLIFRIPSLRQKQLEHWKYTTDHVDRRLVKTPDRPDLFTRILEKSDGPDGLGLQELYSISSLFMIAGTETTATALSGTMYYLLKTPKYLESLENELRAAFTDMEDMSLESLARLPILDATIKEGLRMFPPVPIGLSRVSPPGGMTLSTYRDDGNFKRPYEFRPERWMGDSEFSDDNLDAFEPFSVGPRNCLGKNLAWHEMRLLLATLLLHFDAELCQESSDWTNQQVFTLWEKPALMCRLTKVGQW